MMPTETESCLGLVVLRAWYGDGDCVALTVSNLISNSIHGCSIMLNLTEMVRTCKYTLNTLPSWHAGRSHSTHNACAIPGIRPQDDNPDAALYPEIRAHIEKTVADTGKKVVIKGCSGGTINSYAFIMSNSVEWRQKHIKAWVPAAPVFGGTIIALDSILNGWQVSERVHHILRCSIGSCDSCMSTALDT